MKFDSRVVHTINQKNGRYITEILDKIGMDESKLPPVMPCGSILGGSIKDGESLCGLKENTPVVLGSFDHPSAARGVGVLNEGEMLLSCGTSWVAFIPVRDRTKIEKNSFTDFNLFQYDCSVLMVSACKHVYVIHHQRQPSHYML